MHLNRSRGVTTAALRHGLESDAFSLVYQPIVHVVDAQPVGLEALVRWRHPLFGMLDPGEFIPMAESSGLIVPLGMRVLSDACRHSTAVRHRRDGVPLRLAVNVSAGQLVQPGLLLPTLLLLFAETGIRPHELVLEVTETRLVARGSPAMSGLRAVQELGVGIAIDDFGVGFSSLAYLKSFPAGTEIKVDRTFIQGLADDRADRAIVAAVAGLAAALGLQTVAEGVETAAQLDVLRELGCDQAQGHLFAPPLPLHELPAALERLSSSRWRQAPHAGWAEKPGQAVPFAPRPTRTV